MNTPTVLILGSNGQLGKQFQKEFTFRDIKFIAPGKNECDITNFDGVNRVIDTAAPDIIINCAAYNAVDDAELNEELANLINCKAVENIAKICSRNNTFFIHFSSDYVFDGKKGDLYFEDDKATPLNVYGKSKLAGERAVLDVLNNSLVFRSSWIYGDGTQNFIFKLSGWASENRILKISSDEVSIPTSANEIVHITIDLMEKRIKGLFHLTNSDYCSRYEWCRYVLGILNKDNIVIPVPMSDFNSPALRPAFAPMSNEKICKVIGHGIPHWKISLKDYLLEMMSKTELCKQR